MQEFFFLLGGKKTEKNLSHVTFTINLNSKISLSVLKPSQVLYGGGRGDNFVIKLPESSQAGFGKLANRRLTSTFFGQDCFFCPTMGDTHSMHDRKVFIFGDQLLPWRLGEGVNCVPVMMVEEMQTLSTTSKLCVLNKAMPSALLKGQSL